MVYKSNGDERFGIIKPREHRLFTHEYSQIIGPKMETWRLRLLTSIVRSKGFWWMAGLEMNEFTKLLQMLWWLSISQWHTQKKNSLY